MSPLDIARIESPRVFISYCAADKKYAELFNSKLRESGFETYFAPVSNLVGDDWQARIKEEIEDSHAMVVLNSPHSQKSNWVKREIEYFTILTRTNKEKRIEKRFFPVILYGVTSEELDLELQRHHCIDCSTAIGTPELLEVRISELMLSIREHFSVEDKNCIEIPVITFAMTREQASELFDESVFTSDDVTSNDKKRYKALKSALKSHGYSKLDAFLNCYKETADNWQPLMMPSGSSIWSIVKEVETQVRQNVCINHKYLVKTRSFSERALSDPAVAPALQNALCILIVDAVSLFHPLLYKRLEGMGLTQSKSTNLMLFVIPPISHAEISIYKFLEDKYIEMVSMKPAFNLFSRDFEIGYELGGGHEHSLSRWLSNSLRQLAIHGPIPNEAKGTKLDQIVNTEENYARYIFGKGAS